MIAPVLFDDVSRAFQPPSTSGRAKLFQQFLSHLTPPGDAACADSAHLALPESTMVYDGSGLLGICEEEFNDDTSWEDIPSEDAYELDINSVLEGKLCVLTSLSEG